MASIRARLIVGFGLILIFLSIQSWLTYDYLSHAQRLTSNAIGHKFYAGLELGRIAVEGQKLRRYEKEYFIYVGNVIKRGKYIREWEGAFASLDEFLEKILENKVNIWSAQDISEAQKWKSALTIYGLGFRKIVKAVDQGQITSTIDANVQIQDAKNVFRILLNGAQNRGDMKYHAAEAVIITIDEEFLTVNRVLSMVAIAGFALVLGLLVMIPRWIGHPISELTKAAHIMSTGNLNQSVILTGAVSEFSELAHVLERMRISQKALIDRLRAA